LAIAATERTALNKSAGGIRQRLNPRLLHEVALVPAIVVALIAGAIVNDAFLTQQNLINILQQSSELAILVIGETLILLTGKFDLSLESIVGVGPMIAGWLVTAKLTGGSGLRLNAYVAVAILFLAGMLVGAINGFLVARVKLNAFMVTLAMLILLRGVTVGLSNGRTMFDLPAPLVYLGSASWLAVPASVWIAGILFLVVGFFLRYHSFGRAIYAVGGNPQAALAGLLLTGRLDSVLSGQGQNMIFTVFAAAVIGGIRLNGGQGTMFGALTGVLLLGTISNILTLSQIPDFWINAAFGGIILAALLLAKLTSGASEE
jgi:simple sugar transport system permease protein